MLIIPLKMLLSFKKTMKLIFVNKTKVADDIYKFSFKKPEGFIYQPGQFFRLTIEHANPDDRGIDRWFTVSSSPTEKKLAITTRIIEQSSTFKKTLLNLKLGSSIKATKPEGDFLLPKSPASLLWVAGGIGITPFRSQIKYLLDKNINDYDIILLYSNKTLASTAFKKIFKKANLKLKSFKLIITLTEDDNLSWKGERGIINWDMIQRNVSDANLRKIYISGPKPMVETYQQILLDKNIKENRIMLDRFPGYKD